MSNCLFCKIINKEIPATIVYEDADILAFLDINPVNIGHTLVIPKLHTQDMNSADDATLAKLAIATSHIARAVQKGLGVTGYNLEVNNGDVAGQIIFHSHWHIIPRFADDGLKHWPGKKYAEGEANLVAEKIKSSL